MVREFKRRREPKTGSVHPRNEPLKVSDKLRPSTVIRILRTGSRPPTVEERDQALRVIISTTQREAFGELLQDARTEPELPRETQESRKKSLKGSRLYHLDLFLDAYGILRVGGRLRRAEMEYGEKHPVVLPKNHHASQLVAKHYHAQVLILAHRGPRYSDQSHQCLRSLQEAKRTTVRAAHGRLTTR